MQEKVVIQTIKAFKYLVFIWPLLYYKEFGVRFVKKHQHEEITIYLGRYIKVISNGHAGTLPPFDANYTPNIEMS